MNTILAGSGGAVSVYFFKWWIFEKLSYPKSYAIIDVCSGLLAGLVSVTCPCNNVENWAALVLGALGGIVYILACIFMQKYKIDDPVEATQVHGFCGLWGLFCQGIFDRDKGVIYTANFDQIKVQVYGIIAIFSWTTFLCYGFFALMKKMNRLRVDAIYEIIGLDAIMHEEFDKFDHVSENAIKVAEIGKIVK